MTKSTNIFIFIITNYCIRNLNYKQANKIHNNNNNVEVNLMG